MSLAVGTTLHSCSLRSAPFVSSPAGSPDPGAPPMRRGLARLGAAVLSSPHFRQPPGLLQRLAGPCRQCLTGPPGAVGRLTGALLPGAISARSGGSVQPPAALGRAGGRAGGSYQPYEAVDKALVNAVRKAEEAKRLAKNYDTPSPAQLRRARLAAGMPPAPPSYLADLPAPSVGGMPAALPHAVPAAAPAAAAHMTATATAVRGLLTGSAQPTAAAAELSAQPPQQQPAAAYQPPQPQAQAQAQAHPYGAREGEPVPGAVLAEVAEAAEAAGGTGTTSPESQADFLVSVLWGGHVRTPEQTSWAEASTSDRVGVGSGGAGAGAGAVQGLLGRRRHKACSRNDRLAAARRELTAAAAVQLQQAIPAAAGAPVIQQDQGVRQLQPPALELPTVLGTEGELQPAMTEQQQPPSPPKRKPRTKRVVQAAAEDGAVVEGEPATAATAAPTTAEEGSEIPAAASTTTRTRRKKAPAPAAGADADADAVGTTRGGTKKLAAAAAAAAAAPPPVEEVKPYLQPGLRPLVPAVQVPGYDGYYMACEGYCIRQPLMYDEPQDVLIVNTPEVARAVVDKLMALASQPYPNNRVNPPVPCRYFACDTEVAFIDVTSETPVGHGAVLCLSIYGGDDLDFSDCEQWTHGSLPAAATAITPATSPATAAATAGVRKDRIWVDVWSEVELDEAGRPIMDGRYVRLKPHHPILAEFKRFLEDPHVKKVWHNYGFDRHVLENMGICCGGFGGDTLHMARLADASRSGKRTYGLDSLTADKDIMRHFTPYKVDKPPRELTGAARRAARLGASPAAATAAAAALPSPSPPPAAARGVGSSPGDQRAAEVAKLVRAKVGMKERFGLIKLRNGVPGKVPELPEMQQLHSLELFRPTWIDYSALDAKATWQLREALECQLRLERWEMEASLAHRLGYETHGSFLHLWHFYCSYWLDFGELLTEMERRGMMVNRAHLAEAQRRAEADKAEAVREFLEWADSKVPGARYMNVSSGLQIRMLLFPDHAGLPTKAAAELVNKARAAAERAAARRGAPPPGQAVRPPAPGQAPAAAAAAAAAAGGASGGEEGAGGGDAGSGPPAGCRVIKVPNPDYEQELAEGKKPSRYRNIELHGIWGRGVPGRLQPEILTATNAAAVSIKVLRGLAGKPGAARKELARLLEARAAAQADSRAAAEAAAAAAEAAARVEVPLVGDLLDEALQDITSVDEGGRATSTAPAPGPKAESTAGRRQRKGPVGLMGPVRVVDDPTTLAALEKEAKDKGLGRLYAACGGGEEGLRACVAVEALCEISAIEKLLTAFIIPLQSDATSTTTYLPGPPGSETTTRAVHRVHCSLNINTETGRLSARRPNLQNQPALEKDRFKVRRAFTADTAGGRTLVVADYGQLELRLLAHMTDCASMKEAFILGGDFHSRTAYGMYDYIQEAVRNGECYLEWDGPGEPDKPLVKDKFASERRKAKVLNFSIAYGKTAHGLAVDFKTTKEEAQETVDKWYADRWEVRKWQEDTRQAAREEGKVRTLLGRTRPLPHIKSPDMKLSGHSNRAAINTPIQGSAADVAAAAMVAIHKSEALRNTGFKLLMQIHDEVILEGPAERADEAKRLVMALMANPWAELAQHWNAPGASGLMQGPGWHRPPPQQPGGHVAGVWRHGGGGGEAVGVGGARGGVSPAAGGGGGGGGGGEVMPLLVELATDCNVADTWYEAK